MYSHGPLHMAVQKQDDQHEHTFSNYVRIRDVVQKTCQRRWTIEKSGERGSGISVLPARHDDDEGGFRAIMIHVVDCDIAVRKFKLHVYFRTNIKGKVINISIYPASNGLNCTTTVLLQGWLSYEITHEDGYAIKEKTQTKQMITTMMMMIIIKASWFLRFFHSLSLTVPSAIALDKSSTWCILSELSCVSMSRTP